MNDCIDSRRNRMMLDVVAARSLAMTCRSSRRLRSRPQRCSRPGIMPIACTTSALRRLISVKA